jgi:hypothetical protein
LLNQMNTLLGWVVHRYTPAMTSQDALQRLLDLRARTPELRQHDDMLVRTRAEYRRNAEASARQAASQNDGTEVLSGADRADLAAWIASMSGYWTEQHQLEALDDFVVDLPYQDVLRILGEEGFTAIGTTDVPEHHHIDYLLDDDGLFAVLYSEYSTLRPGPRPNILRVFGNVEVIDMGLWRSAWFSREMILVEWPDGRLYSGDVVFCFPRGNLGSSIDGSFRVQLALLRAATHVVTPWQAPAITTWLGPDSPPGMIDSPREEIVRVSRSNTREALLQLPEHVHARLGPLLLQH